VSGRQDLVARSGVRSPWAIRALACPSPRREGMLERWAADDGGTIQ